MLALVAGTVFLSLVFFLSRVERRADANAHRTSHAEQVASPPAEPQLDSRQAVRREAVDRNDRVPSTDPLDTSTTSETFAQARDPIPATQLPVEIAESPTPDAQDVMQPYTPPKPDGWFPSPVDGTELRTADGYACKIERMDSHPDVALLTLGDGTRYALPTEVAHRLLTTPGLNDEQKMMALLTYPNLAEASTDGVTREQLAAAEARVLPEPPADAVAAEIMETPELRTMAFQVPEGVQTYIDSLPQEREQKGP